MNKHYKIWATIEEVTVDGDEESYKDISDQQAFLGDFDSLEDAQAAMNQLDQDRL